MKVELRIVNGHLMVVPTVPQYSLEDLLAGITPDNCHAEVDAGTAVGQEIG
ncbi:MAG: hypothetical protein AAFX01_10000 [Cyanobacteria bacterium J06638_28]